MVSVAGLTSSLVCLLVILVVTHYDVAVAQTCAKETACSCRLDDGQLIDLTPLAGNAALINGVVGWDDYKYHFSPCSSEMSFGDTCVREQDAGACQEAGDGFHSLGRTSTATFSFIRADPYQILLTLGGGETTPDLTRVSEITILCDLTIVAELVFEREREDWSLRTLNYEFTLRTRYGCPGYVDPPSSSSGGLTPGSIMVIIFFVVLVVYLAAGIAYQIARHQKTGVEVLPNLEFWKSTPGLVKDGGLFLVSLLRRCGGGGGDGYSALSSGDDGNSSGKGSTYDQL